MSMTDPIADLLCRIKNAHLAKHDRLDAPASRIRVEICRILKEQGFITDYELLDEHPVKKGVRILLRYTREGEPAIRHLARVSSPGRRVYRSAADLKPVLNGLGVGVVSTSAGVLTDKEARDRKVGGEILCEVW